MSVTIRPSGEAYRLARDVIGALGDQCPGEAGQPACQHGPCTSFEPHLTVQYVYAVPEEEVDAVAAALERLYRGGSPVKIAFGPVGTFPGYPGVHVDVEAS